MILIVIQMTITSAPLLFCFIHYLLLPMFPLTSLLSYFSSCINNIPLSSCLSSLVHLFSHLPCLFFHLLYPPLLHLFFFCFPPQSSAQLFSILSFSSRLFPGSPHSYNKLFASPWGGLETICLLPFSFRAYVLCGQKQSVSEPPKDFGCCQYW